MQMALFMENVIMKHGIKKNKLRKEMHKYTISNGKLVGDFEGLYKNFKDPFLQSTKEKFETSKKIIINYCQLLQNNKIRKLRTLEIGCGFGQLTSNLSKLKFKSFGTDISSTAITKAKKIGKGKFYTSSFLNFELYKKINPDVIILAEISWYVLPELKKFIKLIKKNFKNKYLIHTLAIYYPGKQNILQILKKF